MPAFQAEIITPDSALSLPDVRVLHAPGAQGRFTILYGHVPLVSSLQPGPLVLELQSGRRRQWDVGPGTLTVDREGVVILVRSATESREPASPPGSPLSSP